MKVALVCLALGLFVGAVQAVPHWTRVPNDVLPSWFQEQGKRDGHEEGSRLSKRLPRFKLPYSVKAQTRENREVDVCMQPVHRGMCLAAHRRFYYDAATGKCQEFVYGGCGGNRNRFDSQRECEQTCGLSDYRFLMPIKKNDAMEEKQVEIRDLEKKIVPPIVFPLKPKRGELDEEFDVCMQPVDAGMCRAAFLQFYYDAATGTCQEFYYGGCGGNGNRFDSLSECEQTCAQPSDLEKKILPPLLLKLLKEKRGGVGGDLGEKLGHGSQRYGSRHSWAEP